MKLISFICMSNFIAIPSKLGRVVGNINFNFIHCCFDGNLINNKFNLFDNKLIMRDKRAGIADEFLDYREKPTL